MEHALVLQGESQGSGDGERLPGVLQVFAVSIVQGSYLTLSGAILLHGVGQIVVGPGKECYPGHPWCKPSYQVGCLEGKPGVDGDLTPHPDDLIPGIEVLEGLELGLVLQVAVTWRGWQTS